MSNGYDQFEPKPSASSEREVSYEHSENLVDLLDETGITLLISTYQAGKLVVIGSSHGHLDLSFHNYDRPMGVAIDGQLNRLAVSTRDAIWIANNETSVAEQLSGQPPVTTCFLTRTAHFTGDIQTHQMAWANDELWIVNTRFSCLCTLDERHSFVPRWQPSFIDSLAAEDRCHLNGIALEKNGPKCVTALGETNFAEGWRSGKNGGGCLIDIDSQQVIARGFSMPHSPLIHQGFVYLLNSGLGSLIQVTASGETLEVGRFPGYTRGLAIMGDLAVVGLSKIRESATFGGLPISDRATELKCGIAIVDLSAGKLLSQFEFKSGVDEIFDVNIVPSSGRVALRGPHANQDGHDAIWLVPTPQ